VLGFSPVTVQLLVILLKTTKLPVPISCPAPNTELLKYDDLSTGAELTAEASFINTMRHDPFPEVQVN
jgi:hypothetical protein